MALFSEIPRRVRVVEVGPRDGLQNEAAQVASDDKVRFIDILSSAGLPVIEVTSFVSPRAVPQLADAADVVRAIKRRAGTRYPVLVPNRQGLERAMDAGGDAIAVFTAASETFNLRNIRMSIEQSLGVIEELVTTARQTRPSESSLPDRLWIRGYVSTCFGCPYEGQVPISRVRYVAKRLFDFGVDEISIGDTIGVATPNQVDDLVGALTLDIPIERLALHFHDTRGTALANVLAGLLLGISTFDSSAGGLGGCPFAPGAAGNLATEDLVYMLHGMGIETGVDLERVVEATRFITKAIGHPAASKYVQSVA